VEGGFQSGDPEKGRGRVVPSHRKKTGLNEAGTGSLTGQCRGEKRRISDAISAIGQEGGRGTSSPQV